MQRKLTSATTLDNLRKEAKRWLKALRDHDAEARERFQTAFPNGPAQPALRDVQHALAREYAFLSWTDLRRALETRSPQPAASQAAAESIVTRFLEYACPDHHVRSRPAHEMARHAAMRILEQNPQIARDNIYTAVVCGEIDEVERLLRERPELANARHAATGPDRSGSGSSYDFLGDFGSKPWEPLLYLSFTRLPLPKTNDNAVAIARLLLDHGADPKASFPAGDSGYTPLVGVIGEGEEDRPPHPRRDELARLLLEHGANPYDGQVIYNIHFHGKILWWMQLMHEFTVRAGRGADWDDPEWHMLDMGGYGSGARWHVRIAIEKNDLELAEWCLSHGANPDAAPESDQRFPQRSLYEHAVRQGRMEIAELLVRHGAPRQAIALDDETQLIAASMRLDREEAGRILARHPEFLNSTKPIFAAAREDRADVVGLLLDLGTPIEVQDEKEQRALHVAAWNDSVRVAELLISRGAEIDPYETNWGNTPLDFAVYGEHTRMIELLRRHSRDVWNLTRIGDFDRLREVIPADPRLAKVTWQTTPLFWLPEDESKALAIAKLFLEHGADAAFRNQKDGTTAAEIARKRGMREVAALLEEATGGDAAGNARGEQLLATYDQLAHDLLAVNLSDDAEALERLNRHFNRIHSFEFVRSSIRERVGELNLEEARDLIARQSGFSDWAAFLKSLAPAKRAANDHEQAAQDFVKAYERDEQALERLNVYYGRAFTMEDVRAEIWRRIYAFRQRSWRGEKNFLLLDEAQWIVAQDAGFSNWDALIKATEAGAPPPGTAYVIDSKENRIGPRRRMSDADWNDLIAVAKEQRITGIGANGLMTDGAMARIASLEHVTAVSLSGSRELTDDGLLQLARMPQLESLELSEYPGGRLTDRGLEVLRHLPNLRTFEMTWQAGITDAGVANLRFCDRLEFVNLMGSPTGDGAIEALQGKPNLHRFSSGRLVTDAGLPFLQNFPKLKKWEGGGEKAARLLLDGPFTNQGLASLAGLEGIADLDLFWHVDQITADGFAHLVNMPNLMALGCDGELSSDAAMHHIAAIPRLQRLRAQESVATDDGFVSLSQSKTLQRLWGRVCPNFGSRGFLAFSQMPTLQVLGVGCANVDDEALSKLPDFPALRELTPIGFTDPGFRHVGRCPRLERLTCMYCRETTDAATEHIAGLKISYYYAGLTKITDRSLEVLGKMPSLEQIELYECQGVTDAGLVFLKDLPRLREVHFDGSKGVTLQGTKVFPGRVRVYHST
ncbi:MAG TPA: ankyrin repeat domain-containing protein [Bryobacteraceae bacterium]|nr:ankyrin repeat domain-containing protein [Bryobacteraceae bacterium]